MILDAGAGASDIYLIQRNLPLNDKEQYELKYSVKGQGDYRAYIEYAFGKKMTSVGAVWQKAPAEWQERALLVKLNPEGVQPKLVFHTRKDGKIELKDLSLAVHEVKPGRNLNFAETNKDGTPKYWTVRGGDGAVTFSDGTATLKKTTEDAPFLIQVPLALEPGKNYRFSAEVKGAKAKYRFYAEEIIGGGKRKTFGRSTVQNAPTDWTPVYFDFAPAEANSVVLCQLSYGDFMSMENG